MLPSCESFLQAVEDYAFIMLDAHGRIQWCNKATASIIGYHNHELAGEPFSKLYTADDTVRRRHDDELTETVKAGKFVSESWKVKKDGSKYWAYTTLSPIYSEQHEHIGFACVLRDLTVRKQAELELRSREERYRLMVEAVKDYSIFMLDSTGHILTWNDGAKITIGYNASEIIGKHFSIFYQLEDLEDGKPQRELEIAQKTGKYEEEGWRLRKNGSLFWSSVVITTLYNEYNELVGFSKVTRDLSKKRQEEEMLLQSEERYRMLVGQVKDYGIFMLDEKGRIISWNEGAGKIKGYTSDEIIGKYFSIFYREEDKMNDRPALELKVARAEGKYEEEGWRVRKDGSMFWANVVITAIYNERGNLMGFAKVTRDLSERKEAEQALKESSEKYKLLANQLKEVNTDLADANKDLEEFTSIVSHDLQEPVRTTKSFLVLIERRLADANPNAEELQLFIEKAIKATNRMRELISNLLQYAQVSKGEVTSEEISVGELIGEVLQNLKSSIDATGASIIIQTDVETIKGDRIQLMQLIQNLLSNSIKFVRDKKPAIRIQARHEADHTEFSISDNGVGIARDSETKVFDIFRREYSTKEFPGTGIGLSICKKIVERHKGKIWLESQLGTGTTFHFTLQ